MCYVWAIPLIATGIQAIGQSQQGQQAAAAGERDALLGEMQAQDALARGGVEEDRYRRQLARVVGAQKAQIGARNVRTSGTALDLLADTAQIGEEDALTIRNDAAREAWGHRFGTGESRRAGRQMARNANFAAAGSALTGAADAYGIWKAA